MASKKCTIAMLICIGTASIFSTCKKGGILGCHESFAYTIDAKVYPDKDTVNIGDTIFVEVNFPTTLTNSTPGEIANLNGASGIATDMGFVKLVNDSPIVLDNAVPDFNFKLIKGREVAPTKHDTTLIKSFFFEEANNMVLFKLAIIPKNIGTYSFNIGASPDVEEKNVICPTFTLNYLLRNTTDQHYYLYPGGAGVTPDAADYYFYVK